MNRLLFLLPVLFIACGTPPKTANGLTAEEEPAERQAKEEVAANVPAANTPAANIQAEEETAAWKQADEKITLVIAADTQNSGSLKQESYEQVFYEVKAFVENINLIIQSRNYSKWREALSEERLKEISSPAFLASVSNMNSMRRRGVVLKTVNDYFLYVVVPSRANSQVDKIEILDNNRVKVFYMQTRKVEGNNNEERTETVPLLVYELAKNGNSWKIIR
jgi:hypothetical protein